MFRVSGSQLRVGGRSETDAKLNLLGAYAATGHSRHFAAFNGSSDIEPPTPYRRCGKFAARWLFALPFGGQKLIEISGCLTYHAGLFSAQERTLCSHADLR
jgi:hypothetical protein